MDFFYPNFNNDMWRIIGMVFFGDRRYFETCCGEATDGKPKKFDRERITGFCSGKGIALYDAACEVRRLRDNASDKFLEIVEPTDIGLLLKQLPRCQAIVTTGQKATDTLRMQLHASEPPVGAKTRFEYEDRQLSLYRMPSSSRAYPLKLEKKAETYRLMFNELGLL